MQFKVGNYIFLITEIVLIEIPKTPYFLRILVFAFIELRGLLKKGEFSNFSGYVHSILDFIVLFCWYTRQHLLALSAILHF